MAESDKYNREQENARRVRQRLARKQKRKGRALRLAAKLEIELQSWIASGAP